MKLIFIGTSTFAVPILEQLIKSDHRPTLVVTAPDNPAGRKKVPTPPQVKKVALAHHIELHQPRYIREAKNRLFEISPTLIVTADYGQIIPPDIINLAEYGSINVHPSLLPRHRGPSPIQTSILDGDKVTGISIIKMDEKIDHGPIIRQVELPLPDKATYDSLKQKLSLFAAELIVETISLYLKANLKPQAQDETRASYTKIITKADGKIDLSQSATAQERKVRAFYPWPGAWTEIQNKRIKVLQAAVSDSPKPNTLKCQDNYLLLQKVQPAGKKPMPGEAFFRGLHNQ